MGAAVKAVLGETVTSYSHTRYTLYILELLGWPWWVGVGAGILQDWLAGRNLIPFISCNATRQQCFISNVCCLSSQRMWGHTTATRKFLWILCTTLKPPQRMTTLREMVPLRALDSSYWNSNRQWAIQYAGSGMHCGTWKEKQTSTQRSLPFSKFCLSKGVSCKK